MAVSDRTAWASLLGWSFPPGQAWPDAAEGTFPSIGEEELLAWSYALDIDANAPPPVAAAPVQLLDDVGAQLALAGLASSSGAGGYVLVKSWLPDSTGMAAQAVALLNTAGLPPVPRSELDRPGFQVLVRGPSILTASSGYEEARRQAEAVKLALHGLVFTSSSGRYYPGLMALQEPFLLEYDRLDRPVIACNYLAWRSRT